MRRGDTGVRNEEEDESTKGFTVEESLRKGLMRKFLTLWRKKGGT